MASTHVTIRDYSSDIPGAMADDGKTWEFPVVRSVNAHGREMMWRIIVRVFFGDDVPGPEDSGAFVPIEDNYFESQRPLPAGMRGWMFVFSGVVGGKVRDSVPTVVASGKNLGKKSATNVWTQALRDALGLYNKARKNSSAAGDDAGAIKLYPPMLSQRYDEQTVPPTVDADHPVAVQRKYDGVRAMAVLAGEGDVIMYSRKLNGYNDLDHIRGELVGLLRDAPAGIYLDGELYAHGVALQDISGIARRGGGVDEKRVKYIVYDCVDPSRPDMGQFERAKVLDGLFAGRTLSHVERAETQIVTSMAEVQALYERYLADGYEGAMLRVDAPYEYSYNNRHSANLLKFKPTLDHEFEIVGFTTGRRGKAARALMVICKTDDGREFNVTPAMEIAERIALANKMAEVEHNGKTHFENHWKGKKIIVKFASWSKDRVPQQGRTELVVRTWD